jgi:hypothetical protein
MDLKKQRYHRAITYPEKLNLPSNNNLKQYDLPLDRTNNNHPSNDVTTASMQRIETILV